MGTYYQVDQHFCFIRTSRSSRQAFPRQVLLLRNRLLHTQFDDIILTRYSFGAIPKTAALHNKQMQYCRQHSQLYLSTPGIHVLPFTNTIIPVILLQSPQLQWVSHVIGPQSQTRQSEQPATRPLAKWISLKIGDQHALRTSSEHHSHILCRNTYAPTPIDNGFIGAPTVCAVKEGCPRQRGAEITGHCV